LISHKCGEQTHTGPSLGFSSRGGQKTKKGAKNQSGGHILKIQYWMYAATEGTNVKWGAPISNWGTGHHWPSRWRRPWTHTGLSVGPLLGNRTPNIKRTYSISLNVLSIPVKF